MWRITFCECYLSLGLAAGNRVEWYDNILPALTIVHTKYIDRAVLEA
jgi:hypothetical protein